MLLHCLFDFVVPVRQRATIFMEIFGNCKLQERTCRYVEEIGQQLRDLVVHNKGLLQDVINCSLMKYREKDELEDVFKSYARTNPFPVDELRDHRLRGFLGDRFDHKLALADWDWHSQFKAYASIIHTRQYKDWRLQGIAYEFGDQTYILPNRTMMSYTEGIMKRGKDRGIKKEVSYYKRYRLFSINSIQYRQYKINYVV